MASHVVVRPGRIDSTAVVDASPHREGLAGTYQRYIRLDADASHDPALLDLELLYRPLFATAFLLAEVLAGDGADDHAASVVITSASSKTGTALAHLVVGGPVEVIGLTSTGNVEHVTGLGLHDRVLAYDELVGLGDLPGPTVLVDLAGRADVVAAVHRALPDGLARHLVVGFTHHDAASAAPSTTDDGPQPEMFFAPTHAARLLELWGLDVLTTRIAAAQRPFIASVASSVTVREIAGLDAAVGEWRHLVDGDVDASEGLIVAI
jgi:hypothetical protein